MYKHTTRLADSTHPGRYYLRPGFLQQGQLVLLTQKITNADCPWVSHTRWHGSWYRTNDPVKPRLHQVYPLVQIYFWSETDVSLKWVISIFYTSVYFRCGVKALRKNITTRWWLVHEKLTSEVTQRVNERLREVHRLLDYLSGLWQKCTGDVSDQGGFTCINVFHVHESTSIWRASLS